MSGILSASPVRGAAPFVEIGRPTLCTTSPDGGIVAVAGYRGSRQWHGRMYEGSGGADLWSSAVGLYRSADLGCHGVMPTLETITCLAFHPTLPLLAVAMGSYDGGYFYRGDLVLLNVVTRDVVSVLDQPRDVERVAWLDEHTLELVLEPASDDPRDGTGDPEKPQWRAVVERDDWDRPHQGMIRTTDAEPVRYRRVRDDPAAERRVTDLCRTQGKRWQRRGSVFDVQSLSDGRVLAAVEGVGLECWADDLQWSVPHEDLVTQVKVAADERSALVVLAASDARNYDEPHRVDRIDLRDGTCAGTLDLDFPAVLIGRSDGLRLARGTDRQRPKSLLLDNDIPAELGAYSMGNHFFDIRHCPDLLALQGDPPQPWRGKQVVAVDEDGRVRRLFPLEWDSERDAHLFGGVGAYLADGPSLIHTGEVHHHQGLQPAGSFVVRRAYPSGAAEWVFTAEHESTALDVDDRFAYVTFSNGELVVLRTDDGTVAARSELRIENRLVYPLSLATAGPGRVVIGTDTGRLLSLTLDA